MNFLGLGHVKKRVLLSLLLGLLCVTVVGSILPAFHVNVSASPETTVAVDPPVIGANPGAYFTINFNVTDVTDLYSYGFRLKWPRGLLETEPGNITEGGFLKQGGSTAFSRSMPETNEIDIGCALLGAVPGVTGSGILANATFKVSTTGTATLDLYRVSLLNSSALPIDDWANKNSPNDAQLYNSWPVARYMYQPHPTEYPGHPIVNETITLNATESYDPDDPYDSTPGGIVSYTWDFGDGNITTVTNPIVTHTYNQTGYYIVVLNVTDDDGEEYFVEKPIIGDSIHVQHHDIAVINATVTPLEVSLGQEFTINITVKNQGSVPETLNVTVYANIQPLNMQRVTTDLFIYWVSPTDPQKTTLNAGDNETTTITWEPTGIAAGRYAISVEAFLVKMKEGKWESAPDLEETNDLYDNAMFYGDVTITGAANHDLAITNLKASPHDLEIDEWATIEVAIKNEGTFTEQFNATVTVEFASTLSTSTPDHWLNQTINAGITVTLEYLWLRGTNDTEWGDYNITVSVVLINGTTLGFLNPYDALNPDDDPTENTRKISETFRLVPVAYFTYSAPGWKPGIMETPPPESEYSTNQATIPAGQTSVTIEHKLVATPTYVELQPSPDDLEGRTYWYTANDTHITIHMSSADSVSDHKFNWSAETRPHVDEMITFNGSQSYPPGIPTGAIAEYTWDFGDGTRVTDAEPGASHIFKNNGTYTITLEVTDNNGLAGNTSVTILVIPFQNIAITDVTFLPHIATIGDSISIDVTVNTRFYEESFNVTTYFNEDMIDTRSNMTLPVGNSATLTFSWDTTSVTGGNYTIKAVVATASENTTYISGIAIVKMLPSSTALSISPASFTIGATTTLNGSVSVAQSELNVTIWYRLTSEETWSLLTNATTNEYGIYAYEWTPETTGTYAVKASWQGNEIAMPSESEVAIAVVQEAFQLNLFLYTTIGLVVALAAVSLYFLKIKKPSANPNVQ